MNLYVIFALAAIGAAFVGGIYLKGEKSCVNSYEVKILKAKIKNQEIALAYYKSAKAKGDELLAEANKKEVTDKADGEKIDEVISKPTDLTSCVDDGFMRNLERNR